MIGSPQAYSLLILTAILLLAVGWVLFRGRRPRLPEVLAFMGLVAALLVAYLYIRPLQTPLMGEAASVRAMIGSGKPVLLEFQSPY